MSTQNQQLTANQQMNPTAAHTGEMPVLSAARHKDLFEGGSGLPSVTSTTLGFRTHDESAVDDSQAKENEIKTRAKVAAQTGASLVEVDQAETQRDYEQASNLLRQIIPANLQDPELHHRLAVDLMSAGEISEAISEFRIASALCPRKPDYSNDLARALSIHKRSLGTSSAFTEAPVKVDKDSPK